MTQNRRAHQLLDLLSAAATSLQTQHELAHLSRLVSRGNLTIGTNTYGIPKIFVSHPDDRVVIGNYCSIAPLVTIIPGGIHSVKSVSTFPFKQRWGLETIDSTVQRRGPVVIDHDVWLCTGSTVLSGTHIGTGAVVAAGSVVTADVEPYAVVGGVPARLLYSRFEPSYVDLLLATRWWEWSRAKILQSVPLYSGGDMEELLDNAAEL